MINKPTPDLKQLDGQSMNLNEHNIEQIKKLFPNVFSEGKIDFDSLKSELGEHIEAENERYHFTWNGKEQAKRMATTPTLGTLRPAPEESVNGDATENLYIEGDNLEVLKLLQKSYFGKVKMIYIDPPYNTGKDFVYKDDFKDNLANYQRLTGQKDEEGNLLFTISNNSEASGRYHSNWLNMMYPRLKLARNLLQDDGIIFISIDDNEVHNLRKICDEIFGEGNFVGQVSLLNNPKGRALDKYMGTCHEYLLIFSKMQLPSGALSIDKTPEQIIKDYPLHDGNGNYRELELRNTHREFGKHNRPNLSYPFYVNENGQVSIDPIQDGFEVWPNWDDGFEGCWTWGKEKSINESHLIATKKVSGNWKIYRKAYAGEGEEVPKKQLKTIFSDKRYYTEKGQQSFNLLFETKAKIFQSPKSPELLIDLLKMSNAQPGDIILDFFSGSATTAHSVMQLNAEDKGNRKFIMVQIPEPTPEKSEARKAGYATIAEIGKERIRRAAKKIKEEYPDTQTDLGFKVFKLDTSNIKKWQPNLDDLETDLLSAVDNILPDRTSQDLLFEVLIKYGLPLTLPIKQLNIQNNGQTYQAWNVANNALIACFDKNLTLDTVQAIAKLSTPENPVLRVIFRDASFIDDITKTNAIQRLKQAGIDDVLSI